MACSLIVCLILSKKDSPRKATSAPGPLPVWSPVRSFLPSIPSNILTISGNQTGAFCTQQSGCRLIAAPAWKFRERDVKLSRRFMEMNGIRPSEGSEKVAFILSAAQRRQYSLENCKSNCRFQSQQRFKKGISMFNGREVSLPGTALLKGPQHQPPPSSDP